MLYYGDEIGMGENIFLGDRNGVRTPMQWSSDKNAGFSRANPQSLYLPIILDPGYHYEAVNVEVQLANPHSLLWWMRRLLALRKRWRALGEGKCEFLRPENRKILSYILRHQQETLLVVVNLSRFMQPVALDLAVFRGCVPVELFGRVEFPVVTDNPYFLTLSPHAFCWFSLESKTAASGGAGAPGHEAKLPALTVADDWISVSLAQNRAPLEAALLEWLRHRAGSAARPEPLRAHRSGNPSPSPDSDTALYILLQVDYIQGDPDLYALPLAFAQGDQAESLRKDVPRAIVCELKVDTGQNGVLYDAVDGPGILPVPD